MIAQNIAKNPDEILRISFLSLCFLSIILAKALSLRAATLKNIDGLLGFWLTPLCSSETWSRSPRATIADLKSLLKRSCLSILVLCFAYFTYYRLTDAIDAKGWLLSYLAVPIVVLFEFACSPVRLLCLATGRRIANIHNHLLRSAGTGDFWRRYNVWVSDWFHQILFRPFPKTPMIASLLVFIFSGLWHEVLINLPFFILFHVNLFGSMMAYFFIQWVAVTIDHVYLRGRSRLRRAFLYVAVVGPAPLILNESLLRIFGWYP
jgi:hypothetical protein